MSHQRESSRGGRSGLGLMRGPYFSGQAVTHHLPRRLSPFVPASWAVSVAAHGLLLFVFATSLQSCTGSGITGEPEGEFREVGIFLKQTNQLDDATDSNQNTEQDENAKTAADLAAPAAEESFKLSDTPPAEVTLPTTTEPVIGIGAGAPVSMAPSDVGQVLKPNTIARPAQALGMGQGDVSFFDVREKGTRFVYVLDSSGSMANYNAIRVAKTELLASLASLDRTQQFQIIFYNQTARAMSLQGERKVKTYFATNQNRQLARQFIAGIRADLGTDHMPAIKKALRMGPEVIFLLTDADEPRLRAADLNEIDRLNQGRTRIHCIEFGKGAELRGDNFLKRLARQNGGTHRYRDVTRFGKEYR